MQLSTPKCTRIHLILTIYALLDSPYRRFCTASVVAQDDQLIMPAPLHLLHGRDPDALQNVPEIEELVVIPINSIENRFNSQIESQQDFSFSLRNIERLTCIRSWGRSCLLPRHFHPLSHNLSFSSTATTNLSACPHAIRALNHRSESLLQAVAFGAPKIFWKVFKWSVTFT